jgi:tetratricopeptide (TPR) repeat protein
VGLHHLGLEEEAEGKLRRSLDLAPPRALWAASACATLSRVVSRRGRPGEAVTLAQAATREAPKWAHAWCVLGEGHVDAGDLKAALRAYSRALKCVEDTWVASDAPGDTGWRVGAGIGRIHLLCHRYQEAADCLTRAVALNPKDAELQVLLAEAHEGLRRPADAARHFDHATVATRGGPTAFAAFADFFTQKAEDALLHGLVENPESRVLLERLERLRVARARA